MSDVAIRVEHLFKQFRLGSAAPYHRFSEFLQGLAAAPVRAVTRKRRSVRTGPAEADAAAPTSFYALNDVSFEVKQGEVLGIIGRNGAGKSTLLKILSRITEPTAGRAEIHGRVGSLLEVGTGFHPELTGRENIFLNGAILGMTRSEVKAKFDEIVAFAETEKFLDTPVKRYSSGMYTRLAFAVAAHLEPEILVIDEVLAVGDAQFQKKCLGKMDDVAKSGRTVLFVSHNMAAVRSLCTSGCVIEGGRVINFGAVSDCINTFLSTITDETLMAKRVFDYPQRDTSPHLTSVRLLANGQPISHFQLGASLVIEAEYEAPYPLAYPKFGFVLYDGNGHPLINANNRYQSTVNEPDSQSSSGVLRCDLGKVPLMAGRYTFSFWFGDHAHDSHFEPHAMSFEVTDADVWGNGQTPPQNITPMWWPTVFEIQSR